ncbi:YfcC family protein [Acetohalobium arabaticum]|uniref:C4-dicarboxylate anaerobic carrier n=1 Tax=Acetohalobium arabaticum (strain ATCC 49924 / DSM 5501 / Z-7288) TaxID=574087 RepID=D9QSH4_ACEAZ|nr:AbgT family transporter [Acetohalobium arabaticum]ADL13437.1 C4-dicarboxylate anaerobic carrier [Acetohalobium arabaticum DSM 5501]
MANEGVVEKNENEKKFKAPDAIVLIVALLIVTSIFTYLLPAGEYNRIVDPETGRKIVEVGSYHQVADRAVSAWGLLQSIPKGMNKAASIINFLLIIGGIFGILEATGSIEKLMSLAINKLKGKERLVVPVILTAWALGGAIIGNFEESLAFIPLQITLTLALGFDSILGVALALCGVGVGYVAAILNPFTVGIAQEIAGVPMFSGVGFRAVVFITFVAVTIIYLYRYAGKIKDNPELSPVYEIDKDSPYIDSDLHDEEVGFTTKHKLVLTVFILGIGVLIYGVMQHGFYLTKIAAVFVGMGAMMGIVGGLDINEIVDGFVEGAHNLLYASIVVGFARAITVVMSDGKILDVIIHGMASMMSGLPKSLSAVGMFFLQMVINLFVSSGSGQAVLSMPIMAPLADVFELTRQTAVLAFQFGDGITNLVTPTSGALMAALAIGKIPWGKWIKWFAPLFMIWVSLASIFMFIAVKMSF